MFLELLRRWPEPPPAPPIDAARFIQTAARHGLAGLAQHSVAKGSWALAADAQLALHREAMAGAARGLKVKQLLFRSLQVLEQKGIVPVLLKGYGLSLRLYPEPLLRATSDVDLLVATDEVSRAAEALTSLGLAPLPPKDAAHAHHLEFFGPAGLVELHYRALSGFGLGLEADALLARAEEAQIEGRVLRYLCPEDELIYLALHASNHLLQRLSWLFDLKLHLMAHPQLDWDKALATAHSTAFPHLAWYALEAAKRLMGAQVPEEVLASLAPPRWQQAVARRVFSGSALLRTSLAENKKQWVVTKLLLAPRMIPFLRYTLFRVVQGLNPTRSA